MPTLQAYWEMLIQIKRNPTYTASKRILQRMFALNQLLKIHLVRLFQVNFFFFFFGIIAFMEEIIVFVITHKKRRKRLRFMAEETWLLWRIMVAEGHEFLLVVEYVLTIHSEFNYDI